MEHDPGHPDHAEEDLGDVIDDAVPSRGYQMLPVEIGRASCRERV